MQHSLIDSAIDSAEDNDRQSDSGFITPTEQEMMNVTYAPPISVDIIDITTFNKILYFWFKLEHATNVNMNIDDIIIKLAYD